MTRFISCYLCLATSDRLLLSCAHSELLEDKLDRSEQARGCDNGHWLLFGHHAFCNTHNGHARDFTS